MSKLEQQKPHNSNLHKKITKEVKGKLTHLEKKRSKWFMTGIMYDTIQTPVAPVTTRTLPELPGHMRATIKENPNMVPVSPRCRTSLFLIRLVGIQPSIVCRVGNSIVGLAIAKYTATIKRATY
jgi:hypothetical protein